MATTTMTRCCEHCGKALVPRAVTFNDKAYHVGWIPCPCDGAKAERKRLEDEEAAAEHERARGLLRSKMAKVGIPKRYLDATHKRAHVFADGMQEGQSFYLHGSQGTGKTHVAMATARVLVQRGFDVEVQIVPHLLEAMRSKRAEDRGLTEMLAKCKALFLDDIDKASPTAYACERLFDIINDRYNSMLPVFVTGNRNLDALANLLSEGDAGRSIASRFYQMCRKVRMDGKDWRKDG